MKKKGDRLRWPPHASSRTSDRTRPVQAQPGLPQPNETDVTSASQSVESDQTRQLMKQAHADVERGLEDTDCRNRAAELVARKSKVIAKP